MHRLRRTVLVAARVLALLPLAAIGLVSVAQAQISPPPPQVPAETKIEPPKEPAKAEDPKAPMPSATPVPSTPPVVATPAPVDPVPKPVEAMPKPVEAAPKAVEMPPKPVVAAPKAPAELRVATFAGAYRQAQEQSVIVPFTATSGVKITLSATEANAPQLLAQLASANPPFDVADVPLAVALAACKRDVLAPVEAASLAPSVDGKPATDDFLDGALSPCGVASVAWSAVAVFERQPGRKIEPKKIADLFDVVRFPGNRALPQGPRYLLEMALLADGVAPNDVYKELSGEEGLARAFRKLDQIKNHIVWWDRPQEAFELVRSKRAALGVAFNGRAFHEFAIGARSLGVIWEGQVYDLNVWVVPKASARRKEAADFIAFATEPKRLAAQASLFPYGPVRKSAIALVGQHPALKFDMKPHLPTEAGNFAGALRLDGGFWSEHEARLKERFSAWLKGG